MVSSPKKNVTDVRKLFSVKNSMTNPLTTVFQLLEWRFGAREDEIVWTRDRAHDATLNVDQHIGNETAETAALGRLPPIY